MSILNYIRDGVSGASGGLLSNLILHPFDLVRNRLAVQDGKSERPKYKGSISIIRSIVRHDGFTGLYRGVTPSLIGVSFSWGLYFPIYEQIKDRLIQHHNGNVPGYQYFFAGCGTGALVLSVTNPIWVVKTQQCLQYEKGVLHSKTIESTYSVLRRLYRSEGFGGLYRGFSAGLLGTIHGGVQFYFLEKLKIYFNPERRKQTNFEMILFPAISKAIAGIVVYPTLLIRSRMQDQHRKYTTLFHCLMETSKEGIFAFFKGITPYLFRTIPASVITFYTYELLRNAHKS